MNRIERFAQALTTTSLWSKGETFTTAMAGQALEKFNNGKRVSATESITILGELVYQGKLKKIVSEKKGGPAITWKPEGRINARRLITRTWTQIDLHA